MSSGFFGVLQDDDSSDEDSPKATKTPNVREEPSESGPLHIPPYEDLSVARLDEVTVLEAVYGDDFKQRDGVWGCPNLQVRVRPPDIEEERIGSHLL